MADQGAPALSTRRLGVIIAAAALAVAVASPSTAQTDQPSTAQTDQPSTAQTESPSTAQTDQPSTAAPGSAVRDGTTTSVVWMAAGAPPSVHSERVPTKLVAARLAELRARPDVLSADVDVVVDTGVHESTEPAPAAGQWWLDRIWNGAVPTVARETDVVVAVVDSGVDASHPDLDGVVLPGLDLIGDGDGRADPNGHGTHVAGIVAALAGNDVGIDGATPGVRILPVRIIDADGRGVAGDAVGGILWAVRQGVDVINLSVGHGHVLFEPMRSAVRYAEQRGVVVVASAGNDGGRLPGYPAAHPEVLAVTAVDADDARPDFASYGTWIDLAAPGEEILSLAPGGGTIVRRGTSMSSPAVSAAAAELLAAEPGITPGRVRARLRLTSRDVGRSGADVDSGYGVVDLSAVSPARAVFVDVPDANVHRRAVVDLAANGVTRGCDATRFCPRQQVMRAELAAFLNRGLRLPAAGPSWTFVDVTGVHRDAIARLAAAGITAGCTTDGSSFCPARSITRAEAASLLARALRLPPAPTHGFVDVPDGSVHAAGIAAVAQAGITRGCTEDGTRFCPSQPLPRDQMASLLARALLGH